MTHSVSIQTEDFSVDAENSRLVENNPGAGALVNFIGLVRDKNHNGSRRELIKSMELEHYPGMTEKSIALIQQEAAGRWALTGSRVIHRVGTLPAGAQIVYVGVCSAHRHESFAACDFIMDYLKTRAPFWKKEHTLAGSQWVDARESDEQARLRWARKAR